MLTMDSNGQTAPQGSDVDLGMSTSFIVKPAGHRSVMIDHELIPDTTFVMAAYR